MKPGAAIRKIVKYFRYDFREIVFPRSLPDPPDYVPPRSFTLRERWEALKNGTRDYLDTWKSQPQPEANQKDETTSGKAEPSLFEEIADTARSSQSLRPVLMKLYESNMTTVQLSIKNFIQGYREGTAEKVTLADILPKGWALQDEAPANSQAEAPTHSASDSQEGPSEELSPSQRPAKPNSAKKAEPEAENGVDKRLAGQLHDAQASPAQKDLRHANAQLKAAMPKGSEHAGETSLQDEQPVNDVDARQALASSNAKAASEASATAEVADALARAEEIAAGMLGGQVSSEQHQRLKEAIGCAEAAIKAAESLDHRAALQENSYKRASGAALKGRPSRQETHSCFEFQH